MLACMRSQQTAICAKWIHIAQAAGRAGEQQLAAHVPNTVDLLLQGFASFRAHKRAAQSFHSMPLPDRLPQMVGLAHITLCRYAPTC